LELNWPEEMPWPRITVCCYVVSTVHTLHINSSSATVTATIAANSCSDRTVRSRSGHYCSWITRAPTISWLERVSTWMRVDALQTYSFIQTLSKQEKENQLSHAGAVGVWVLYIFGNENYLIRRLHNKFDHIHIGLQVAITDSGRLNNAEQTSCT